MLLVHGYIGGDLFMGREASRQIKSSLLACSRCVQVVLPYIGYEEYLKLFECPFRGRGVPNYIFGPETGQRIQCLRWRTK